MSSSRFEINRRLFIKGGVTLSLPWLVSLPGRARAKAASPALKFVATYWPNGTTKIGPRISKYVYDYDPKWNKWDSMDVANFTLNEFTRALEPVKSEIIQMQHLKWGAGVESTGKFGWRDNHRYEAMSFLTGYHEVFDKATGKSDLARLAAPAGVEASSIDVRISAKVGKPPLILGLTSPSYSSFLSWAAADKRISASFQIPAVFKEIFGGTPASDNQIDRVLAMRKSILDEHIRDLSSMKAKLNAGDRRLLERFEEDLRAIERSAQPGPSPTACIAPSAADFPEVNVQDKANRMIDLIALAFQCDRMDTATLTLFPHGGSGFPLGSVWDGLSTADAALNAHEQSHITWGGDANAKRTHWSNFQKWHIDRFKYLIDKFKATPYGDANLLYHSVCVHGTGNTDADLHSVGNNASKFNDGSPRLLAGRAGGRIRTGRCLQHSATNYPPAENLLRTIQSYWGITAPVGNSTGVFNLS